MLCFLFAFACPTKIVSFGNGANNFVRAFFMRLIVEDDDTMTLFSPTKDPKTRPAVTAVSRTYRTVCSIIISITAVANLTLDLKLGINIMKFSTLSIGILLSLINHGQNVDAFAPNANANANANAIVSYLTPLSLENPTQKTDHVCYMMKADDHDQDNLVMNQAQSSPLPLSRRSLLLQLATVPTAASAIELLSPQTSHATDTTAEANKVHISAYWKSVDGLNSLDSSKQFVSFDTSSYTAMMDDPARTPFFEKAIIQRLNNAPKGPESQTVLDLGTGPFALFAIIAAQAGAGKVYAIEASPKAAKSARAQVRKLGFQDIITILEGFSTDITLPDGVKADFALAEIIGSVATEEGAYATILDAHKRLVKDPSNPSNWIPSRVQTLAAPASYTLHNLFQPPEFDWGKLKGDPVRFNCRDEGLQLLADPLFIEDISFADIEEQSKNSSKKNLKFIIDEQRVEDNTIAFYEEFRNARLDNNEAEKMAKTTGRSLTGIALWPRLILDGEGSIEVNSRSFPTGGHQKSHWQTVLPIMCDVPVVVKGSDEVLVDVDFDVSDDVLRPPTYRLEVDILQK